MRNAEEQQVFTGVITSLPTLTDIYGDQEASHPIMQLFWPKEMKEKHVSIGRPPINLQRQFSQDLKLKVFCHFVSGHDLCPPAPHPPEGDVTLWWPAPPYTCYICAVARVHGGGFDAIGPHRCSPLDYRLLPRREERDRGSLSPRTYEILIL